MDRLEDKYDENKVQDVMSRADFWALCSHVAINSGAKFGRYFVRCIAL